MNAFEREKERIMKKLRKRELMNGRVFESENSQAEDRQGNQQHQNIRNDHDDNSTEYIPDREEQQHQEQQFDLSPSRSNLWNSHISQQENIYNQGQHHQGQQNHQEAQTQHLREQLITIHQHTVINKIYHLFQNKLYWLQFSAFHQIHQSQHPYFASKHIPITSTKISKIRKNLIKNIFTINPQTQGAILQNVFFQWKSLKHTSLKQYSLKTSFFTKYFIKPAYNKLTHSFHLIKTYPQNQSPKFISQQQVRQKKLQKHYDQLKNCTIRSKIVKTQFLTKLIANLIINKSLKPAFLQLITHQLLRKSFSSNEEQNALSFLPSTHSESLSKFQPKDARFIKKKPVPHKIIPQNSQKRSLNQQNNNLFNLNHIYFKNYELKTIQKHHLEFVKKLTNLYIKKVLTHFGTFFQLFVKEFHQPGDEIEDGNSQNQLNQQSTDSPNDNSDFDMIQNVMKSICYLSSKIHTKRKAQTSKSKRANSLAFVRHILIKKHLENLSSAFYSIKSFNFLHYVQTMREIKQLQEQKRHYLQEFSNSLMESQENQQY